MDTAPYSSGMVPPPPPPPVITAPPPPKLRRSRGWMIFAIILLVLLVVSLFGNFTQLVSQALTFNRRFAATALSREVGPYLDECVIKDNDAASKIAVITVDGIISDQMADQAGYSMVDVIRAQLDRAKDDRRVKAVILKVDSPGGEVLASDEIYRAINGFSEGFRQTGGLFHGQSGRLGRLLYFVALPLDCGQRPDHHRQHRRDSAHVELPRIDGQDRHLAGNVQERQVQGHAQRRTRDE